jgi:hypothetical protein
MQVPSVLSLLILLGNVCIHTSAATEATALDPALAQDSTTSVIELYRAYNEQPGLDHYFNYGYAYDDNIHQIRTAAVRNNTKASPSTPLPLYPSTPLPLSLTAHRIPPT